MKSNKTLLTGLLALAVGIMLVICNSLITGSGIVTVAGLLFLVIGVINLILYVTQKDDNGQRRTRGFALVLGWLVSVSSIILGLCMLIFNDTFNQMIPFIFGLIVLFGAIMSASALSFGLRKIVRVPPVMWIMPGTMLVLAVIIATRTPVTDDSLIMILTGAAVIVFGVEGLVVSAMTSGVHREATREAAANAPKDNKKRPAAIEAESKNTKELKPLDD